MLLEAPFITASSHGVPGRLSAARTCTSKGGGASKATWVIHACNEMGRQPVAAASALSALERAGFAPAVQDVSVEKLSDEALRAARLVLVSVPMHTALQLGVRVAARARAAGAKAVFFGLYAALN